MKRTDKQAGRIAVSLRTLALVLVVCMGGRSTLAGVGDADVSFGTAGIFQFPAGYDGLVEAPGGRLQLAAIVDGTLKVRRFDADARPDATFGTGGELGTPVSLGPTQVRDVKTDPAGITYLNLLSQGSTVQIPVSPGYSNIVEQREARLMRLLPDGRPDPAFGPDGTRRFPFTAVAGANITEIVDLALAPGGAVYALVNYLPEYYECNLALRIHRLLPTGELDTTFGNAGVYPLEAGCSSAAPRLFPLQGEQLFLLYAGSATVLDARGRAIPVPAGWRDPVTPARAVGVTATDTHVFTVRTDLALGLTVEFARWNHALEVDGLFGEAAPGRTVVAVQNLPFAPATIEGIRLLAPRTLDEHLYALVGVLSSPATASGGGRQYMEVLMRLQQDGKLDRTFGIDGVVIARTGSELRLVAQRPDGSLVVGSRQRRAIRLSGRNISSPGLIELGLACDSRNVVSEKVSPLSIRVWRSWGSQGALSVDFYTLPLTAMPGTDYREARGTLNWAAGTAGEKRIDVELIDDDLVEADEEFRVVLDQMPGNPAISCDDSRIAISSEDAFPSGAPVVTPDTATSGSAGTAAAGGGGGSLDVLLLALLSALVMRSAGLLQSRSRNR